MWTEIIRTLPGLTFLEVLGKGKRKMRKVWGYEKRDELGCSSEERSEEGQKES